MKRYHYDTPSPIDNVEFRQSVSGSEAVIFPAVTHRPEPKMVHLPDALRKQGMDAELIVSGRRPALRVRGFADETQVLDTIRTAGLGSPAPEQQRDSGQQYDSGQQHDSTPHNASAPQGGFAARVAASRSQSTGRGL